VHRESAERWKGKKIPQKLLHKKGGILLEGTAVRGKENQRLSSSRKGNLFGKGEEKAKADAGRGEKRGYTAGKKGQ